MGKETDDIYSLDTVLEDYLRSIESNTDSPRTSTSKSEREKDRKSVSLWAGFVQLFKIKSKSRLATLHPLNISKRFSSSMREEVRVSPNPVMDTSLKYVKPRCKNFSFCKLQIATNNFSQGLGFVQTLHFEPLVLRYCQNINFAFSIFQNV